jgi:hypothetical protein
MRTDLAFMRVRAITFVAALVALALIPSSALAAPKKVSFKFSATAYSVVESNTTFNVTVQRQGNTGVATSATVTDAGTGSAATPANYTVASPTTVSFAIGQTSRTVPVTIKDNTTFDPNKTIVLHLTGPGGTQVKTAFTTITIVENDGPGTIDFSSPTYNVVEGAGVATVSVNRNSATNLSESVAYTTTALVAGAGHATAGSDYMTTSGTLTFGPAEMTKTFQVPVLDDAVYEGDETLGVTLSNPQNLTNPAQVPNLGPNNALPAVLTILDDDISNFAFSASTYSTAETAGTKTITVTRTGRTDLAASVDYSDSGSGSACPAPGPCGANTADYTLAAGTLNFAAGQTSATFDVTIADDGFLESNETVGLQLTRGATQLATANLSIVDDDNPSASIQFSDVAYSTGESGSATITVTLSKPVNAPVSVNYATSDPAPTATNNPATAGSDYTAASGALNFAANETSKTFSVPILSDTSAEGDETVNLTLSGGTNAALGEPSQAVLTIVDDDLIGSLEFSSLRYDVNEAGGPATVTVHRIGGATGPVSVDYFTSDGSAMAPGDYSVATGTLDFGDGEVQKTFVVPVAWDGLAEGDETISLGLANPAGGADLGPNLAAVLHVGDDGASGPVQFTAASFDVNESAGTATITVARSGGSLGGPVTVDYATSDGSATAGSDYTEMHGTLTFGPGETSKSFDVPITNDSAHEDTETVNLTLSNPGGGTSLGNAATAALTIADDDAAEAPAPNPAAPTPAAPAPAGFGGPQSSPANPNPAGSQTAAADKIAPKLTLSAKKLQRALKAKVIVIKVRSSEAASLTLSGKVFKGKKGTALGKRSLKAPGGKAVTIKLKLSKKALAAIRKALAKGKASVTLTVVAVDLAGNKGSAVRRISVS